MRVHSIYKKMAKMAPPHQNAGQPLSQTIALNQQEKNKKNGLVYSSVQFSSVAFRYR